MILGQSIMNGYRIALARRSRAVRKGGQGPLLLGACIRLTDLPGVFASLKEIGDAHVKSMSDSGGMAGHVVLATGLDALDRRPVHLGRRRKLLLGEVPVDAVALNLAGGDPASGENPGLFCWGWYPAQVTASMIESRQQY